MMNIPKDEIRRLLVISFGVFLFVLFFQPFPLDISDFNNRLLYFTGFGLITFIFSGLLFILIPAVAPFWRKLNKWEGDTPYIPGMLFLVLNSIAFAFYIRYVGHISLDLYIIFKIILVCLLPVIILLSFLKSKFLINHISELERQHNVLLKQSNSIKHNVNEQKIEIFSENQSDKLRLLQDDIIYVKSADNYIEIYYYDDEIKSGPEQPYPQVRSSLIRNTLKNIEKQLSEKKLFIRTHRTHIVNKNHIEKIERSYSGYSLKLYGISERIPISRQYLNQVKIVVESQK